METTPRIDAALAALAAANTRHAAALARLGLNGTRMATAAELADEELTAAYAAVVAAERAYARACRAAGWKV